MLVKESLVKILEPYMDCPTEMADRIMYESVYLGKTVYVVTQYTKRSKYEVLEAVVSTMRYNPRKSNKSFTVEGLWANGNYYNGTFRLNSIGKTVFLNPLAAHRMCLDKNGGQSDG
jgi:hypothetical protein